MAIIEKHRPGSFCWFELATTDQKAAKNFYTSLFGWAVTDNPMGPGEVYSIFKLQGRDAAAGYTMRKEQREQGVPPNWMVYISVENADQSAQKAAQAGGTILAPPFDVMEEGRMAVVQDRTGAIFSLWQPKRTQGVGIAASDNTFCWADLNTVDPERAAEFYSQVFGWKLTKGEHDPSGYLHIQNGDGFIGGVPPAGRSNPQTPPHWLIYFQVGDVSATAAKASQLGGKVYMPPRTIENVGDMAVVADPQGAVFALFKSARNS